MLIVGNWILRHGMTSRTGRTEFAHNRSGVNQNALTKCVEFRNGAERNETARLRPLFRRKISSELRQQMLRVETTCLRQCWAVHAMETGVAFQTLDTHALRCKCVRQRGHHLKRRWLFRCHLPLTDKGKRSTRRSCVEQAACRHLHHLTPEQRSAHDGDGDDGACKPR